MTVQDVTNTIDYIGDGFQTSFAFVFRADDTTWIDLNFTTDLLSITLNADQDSAPGGSVEYSVAPPNLQLIRITRITPQDQDLDYTRYDAFDSESHEDALDKLTMQVQDLQETIDGFTSDAILANGTLDDTILRWNDTGQTWDEFFAYIFPLLDGAAGQAIVTDGAGNLGFSTVAGAVDDGTVDGQINIWDVGADQWVPVAASALQINPQVPPTSPLGRIISGTTATTDVRKAVLVVNVGASVSAVWSTNKGGGTQEGFYSRSELNGSTVFHNWGFWNDANQTGIDNFTIFDDGRFLLENTLYMEERAAALANTAGRGQFWVRDDVPNTPMFRDDAGNDSVLNASGGAFRGCKAYSTLNRTMPNDLTPTFPVNLNEIALILNAEAFDTDSIHDNVTNNTRLTVPAGVTRIILRAGATINPNPAGLHHMRMRKGGGFGTLQTGMSFIPHHTKGASGSGSNKGFDSFSSGIIDCVAGDFYEVYGLGQNNITTYLAGTIWFEMEIIQ